MTIDTVKPVTVGDEFSRWRVLALNVKRSKDGRAYHLCWCSCGTIRPVLERSLLGVERKTGRASHSCGCWRREATIARNIAAGAKVDINGQVRFLSEIATEAGVNKKVASARWHRYRWPLTRLLMERVHSDHRPQGNTLAEMWRRLDALRVAA
jgi:hypothetical protein